jgi:hypothetical protein
MNYPIYYINPSYKNNTNHEITKLQIKYVKNQNYKQNIKSKNRTSHSPTKTKPELPHQYKTKSSRPPSPTNKNVKNKRKENHTKSHSKTPNQNQTPQNPMNSKNSDQRYRSHIRQAEKKIRDNKHAKAGDTSAPPVPSLKNN